MSVARVARWKPSCLSLQIFLSFHFYPPFYFLPASLLFFALLPSRLFVSRSERSRRQLRWQEARNVWRNLDATEKCARIRSREKGGKREDRVSLLLEESRACKSRFGERISFPSPPINRSRVYGNQFRWTVLLRERERERRIVVEFDLELVAVEIEGKGSSDIDRTR